MITFVVAGFATCPFHQQALNALKPFVEQKQANLQEMTFGTRDEFRTWLFSNDGRMKFNDARAKKHTSSPFVFNAENGDFIGGCDDTMALLSSDLFLKPTGNMNTYDLQTTAIRQDLVDAHENTWSKLVQCGTFYTAEERVQIARLTRIARSSNKAKELKASSEQFVNELQLDGYTTFNGCTLSPVEIDLIHRIVVDPGRMANAEEYYQNVTSMLEPGAYVEIVGIVALMTHVDTFSYGIGRPLTAIPTAPMSTDIPEKIIGLGQECIADLAGRVPVVPVTNATNPLTKLVYENFSNGKNMGVPNILKMLSAVPLTHATFARNLAAMYLGNLNTNNMGGRAINRSQIELLATKVSQLNVCAY